jgi:hypothetical protein
MNGTSRLCAKVAFEIVVAYKQAYQYDTQNFVAADTRTFVMTEPSPAADVKA